MSDIYRHVVPGSDTSLEATRLHWERHELHGQLCIRCSLPGARTIEGILFTGAFNFSSYRATQDRAKMLTARANTNGHINWSLILEDFSQSIIQSEQRGRPGRDLSTFEEPIIEEYVVDGLAMPKNHASILFGDGGCFKSYMALYFIGQLAKRGIRVGYFDWELSGEEHRLRLRLLFGRNEMPAIHYCHCDAELTAETERLRREVKDNQLQYIVYDSIAFACDGPPETAEAAQRYFRSVRQIGGGSLHIAHINKSENADKKPFGSAFWHNGARSTWFVEAAETGNDPTLQLLFQNRKSNLGALHGAVNLQVHFHEQSTSILRGDVGAIPEFTQKLTCRQRIFYALKKGSRSFQELVMETGDSEETVRKELYRHRNDYIQSDNGKYSLK